MAETHAYRLKFHDNGADLGPEIEFEAPDAYRALVVAHDLAESRTADLWCDGTKICTIRRLVDEVWEVGPALETSEQGRPALLTLDR